MDKGLIVFVLTHTVRNLDNDSTNQSVSFFSYGIVRTDDWVKIDFHFGLDSYLIPFLYWFLTLP